MIPDIDLAQLRTRLNADRELGYKLRGLSALVRLAIGRQPIDIEIKNGAIGEVRPAGGAADLTIGAPDEFWSAHCAKRHLRPVMRPSRWV